MNRVLNADVVEPNVWISGEAPSFSSRRRKEDEVKKMNRITECKSE